MSPTDPTRDPALNRAIDLAAAARLDEAGWHDLARALRARHLKPSTPATKDHR